MALNNTLESPASRASVKPAEAHALHLSAEEIELLRVYRRAKSMEFADISITIQEGKRVKMWLTEKLK